MIANIRKNNQHRNISDTSSSNADAEMANDQLRREDK